MLNQTGSCYCKSVDPDGYMPHNSSKMKIAEQHQEAFMKLLLQLSKEFSNLQTDDLISRSVDVFESHVLPLRKTIDVLSKDMIRIQNENERLKQKLAESVRLGTTLLTEMQHKSNERIVILKDNAHKLAATKKEFEGLLKV